jgi:hypothetical protein
MSAVNLNAQQQSAVEQILSFCSMNDPDQYFMLSGSAGTGKTTCIQKAVKELLSDGVSVCLTSPTNKATKVLKQTAMRQGLGDVECRTVYSLLGLRMDTEHEFIRVVPIGDSDVSAFHVVVVDEASMVGKVLLGHITEAANAHGVKFIFMGDPMQLPPVKEKESPTFAVERRAHLSQVMRHDNQILTLATSLRDCIQNGTRPVFKSDNDSEGGVWCVDHRKMTRFMQQAYTSEIYQYEPESIKTVAWRNATVDAHNTYIRSCIYGTEEKLPKFMKDERVIATHPITALGDTTSLMNTDEEANCSEIQEVAHPIINDIDVYALSLETDFSEGWIPAFVPHERSEALYKKKLNDLYERAKKREIRWSQYHEFRQSLFHNVRPCHAITAHRSQGSTYRNVVVDVQDILSNRTEREALQCLYVAVSRASKTVVLKTR